MRMELSSFYDLLFNPVAQSKFVHTISAGYVCGSLFILAISSWYLLRGRHQAFAKRSMVVASAFGLAASLSVVVLGDESGYNVTENQKMKLAAIEAEWKTEPAPAALTLFAIPDQAAKANHFAIQIPWALGLIATRSFSEPVQGIEDLVAQSEQSIKDGLVAYDALQRLSKDRTDKDARQTLMAHASNLGHALLLKKYVDDPRKADDATIALAAQDTVPNVTAIFWSFRVMGVLGFYFIALFVTTFWLVSKRQFDHRGLQTVLLWSWPLPWIAAEFGWVVAEYGRQPWAIDGVLPTALGSSALSLPQVLFTLCGFVLFYSSLLVVEIILMRKYIRMGPVEALYPAAPSLNPAAVPAE
jgi:cytochrome d ubiquinol oxidase subunit I